MTEDDLVSSYPRLWHMAEDGSWPSIRENGLLSTSALLDLYQVEGPLREALEARRRPSSVRLPSRPGMPDAVVRDQKPMSDERLARCLDDGLVPGDWYRILNAKTFFWLSRDRLRGLLGARAYRRHPQTVLTLDTASLVAAQRGRVLLSPINSGATLFAPPRRGRGTFTTISNFPFAARRATRPLRDAVVELVVEGGVRDVVAHVLAVHRVVEEVATELWRRPGTVAADGP